MVKEGGKPIPKSGLFIFCLLSFFVYLPAFFIEFGFHNDYAVWSRDPEGLFPETWWLILIGRPLQAQIMNVLISFQDSISDFAITRFVSFLAALASSLIIARYLVVRLRINPYVSLMTAFCILTLPSMQINMVWSNLLVPGSLNILLAVSSYMVLDWPGIGPRFYRRVFFTASAMSLFIAALLIYPPTAMALLIFPSLRLLFSQASAWPLTRRLIIRDIVFAASGETIYYALNKFAIAPYIFKHYYEQVSRSLDYLKGHPIYELSISTDITEKTRLFLGLSETALAGVWHIAFGNKMAPAVLAAILLGAALKSYISFYKTDKLKLPIFNASQIVVALSVLIILANSPLLAAKSSVIQYRVLFPYSAIAVLALFSALSGLKDIAGQKRARFVPIVIMVSFVCLSGFISSKNVLQSARNAKMELAFVRKNLGSADLSHVKDVYVIPVPWGATMDGSDLRYEFAFNSTNYNFVPGLFNAILEEKGIKAVPSYPAWINLPILVDDGSLIIDMNDARTVGSSYADHLQIIRVGASSAARGDVRPSNAFDMDTKTLWTSAGYPQELSLSFTKDKKIVGYRILSDGPALTAPQNWKLMASDDGREWAEIDRRTRQEFQSEITCILEGPVVYRNYRWIFLSGHSKSLRIADIELL